MSRRHGAYAPRGDDGDRRAARPAAPCDCGGRGPVPVELDAPADASVAAAAEAIAHTLDAEPGEALVARTGAVLDSSTALGAAGLRHGDRLELGSAEQQARPLVAAKS
jgi:hypothetical protein